jgi:hypothetical protein
MKKLPWLTILVMALFTLPSCIQQSATPPESVVGYLRMDRCSNSKLCHSDLQGQPRDICCNNTVVK